MRQVSTATAPPTGKGAGTPGSNYRWGMYSHWSRALDILGGRRIYTCLWLFDRQIWIQAWQSHSRGRSARSAHPHDGGRTRTCRNSGRTGSDRECVEEGKGVSVCVDTGGRRIIQKKTNLKNIANKQLDI